MPLTLYSSLTKREEEFRPLKKGEVTMYTCGPTVYGRPHIGNYASFLMADLLRRWLEVSGFTVKHVKNITDVGHLVADADEGEDKVEQQAKAEKVDPLSIARKYADQYIADEQALHFLEPAARPHATEYIPQMIAMIKQLIKDGKAYETDDGVYFCVESFPHYGQLSGNTLDKLEAGARVSVDEGKRHPADFALWKKAVKTNAHHILRWSSPWGEGFPGWHIECSAMSRSLLGDTIDIHTGGEDNIFPHHECEIAQTESVTGKPFVRYWLHRRRIEIVAKEDDTALATGVKMSKSLGNVLNLDDIVARGFSALDLRYLLLSVHYRTRLKFSWKGLKDAHKARRRIVDWMIEMDSLPKGEMDFSGKASFIYADQFTDAMNSDLNVSGALAAVFAALAWTRNQGHLSREEQAAIHAFIAMVRRTFGCFDPEQAAAIPTDIQALITERDEARALRNFAESDRLRDAIKARGYSVEDTAQGTKVTKA